MFRALWYEVLYIDYKCPNQHVLFIFVLKVKARWTYLNYLYLLLDHISQIGEQKTYTVNLHK